MSALLFEENPTARRATAEETTSPVPARAPNRTIVGESRHRILFVDDHEQIRRLGQKILVQSGYEVNTAIDGFEAWTALHEQDYHLLVTDNQMPRLAGLELIRKLRSERMTLPVILVSGTLALLPADELVRLECEAVLAKPFTTEQLVSAVQKILRTAANPRTTGARTLEMEESHARSQPSHPS